MAYVSEDKIAAIVEKVMAKLAQGERPAVNLRGAPAPVDPPYGCDPTKRDARTARVPEAAPARRGRDLGRGVFIDLDEAVTAARSAFATMQTLGLAKRYEIIAAMRAEAHRQVDAISRMAV